MNEIMVKTSSQPSTIVSGWLGGELLILEAFYNEMGHHHAGGHRFEDTMGGSWI